jgi:methionine-rich copper-binding protein CopC
MTARRLLVTTLVGVGVAVSVGAPPAFGHSAFVGSSPAPGTRLGEKPAELSLRFTEPLNRRLSRAELVAVEGGERFPVEVSAPSAKRLTLVPSGPLPRGAYRVEWHTVSTLDGHALEGSFSFGCGRRPPVLHTRSSRVRWDGTVGYGYWRAWRCTRRW